MSNTAGVNKGQLIASMRHEAEIIKHLKTCIPEGAYEYVPGPEQRSMRELLGYLSVAALSPCIYAVNGNWDHAADLYGSANNLDLAGYDAAMDHQISAIEETLAAVSDEDLATRQITMPWGTPCTLGEGLLNMGVKTLTAYRMQLFLYIKAAGNKDIGSYECWAGGAPPQG
ncbi:MAG: hypothetical protein AAF581_12380 [Planctomycetota bacterium]